MKSLMILSLLALTFSCNANTKKTENTLTSSNAQVVDGKKEEDCDDKAKKPIEIKEESISLGGGNTGCTLEEADGKPKL